MRNRKAAVNQKLEIENQLNQQELAMDKLQSEKRATESQLSYCNRQLNSKQSQIERLESGNEGCETQLAACELKLAQEGDSKSELKAIQGKLSYCNRQLQSKQRCFSNLIDQKRSFTSMEERYNTLVKSELILIIIDFDNF